LLPSAHWSAVPPLLIILPLQYPSKLLRVGFLRGKEIFFIYEGFVVLTAVALNVAVFWV
jgi:hypothetical protein